MNGAVEMECDRECRLLLNDLNGILSEQCLEQRVGRRYLNDPCKSWQSVSINCWIFVRGQ